MANEFSISSNEDLVHMFLKGIYLGERENSLAFSPLDVSLQSSLGGKLLPDLVLAYRVNKPRFHASFLTPGALFTYNP